MAASGSAANDSGWSKTLHFTKEVSGLVLLLATSTATPTAAVMVFGPPVVSQRFVVVTFCLAQAFIIAISFLLLRASSLRNRGWVMLAWAILFVGSAIVYQAVWSGWVVTLPKDEEHPIVVGYTLRPDIEKLVETDVSIRTKRQLLEHFNNDPEEIWTDFSREVIRTLLFVSWLAYWLSPFGAITAFIAAAPWPRITQIAKAPK